MKFKVRKNRDVGPHNAAFKIDANGDVLIVQHPNEPLCASLLGEVEEPQPGGHVWPRDRAMRLAFKVLRLAFGRMGLVADWTRTWACEWVIVDPVNGVTIPETYPTHAAACVAEIDYVLVGDGHVYWGYVVSNSSSWDYPEVEGHA